MHTYYITSGNMLSCSAIMHLNSCCCLLEQQLKGNSVIFKTLHFYARSLILDLERFGFGVWVLHHRGLCGRAAVLFSLTDQPTGLVVINKQEES